MKKRFILVLGLLAFLISGCTTTPPQQLQDMKKDEPGTTQQPQTDNRSSLGKIHLGDELSLVQQVLGKDYKETYHEEPGHFPEAWYSRDYSLGITVIVGKNSGKVLEVQTESAEFPTNLGVKVGDTAKVVSEQYGAKYKNFESPHGDGPLEGFYVLEDEKIIIFDYDKEDSVLGNIDVKPDSKVEMIRLTSLNQLD